jgi:hypothetical protein
MVEPVWGPQTSYLKQVLFMLIFNLLSTNNCQLQLLRRGIILRLTLRQHSNNSIRITS